jgi:hypothetical protein
VGVLRDSSGALDVDLPQSADFAWSRERLDLECDGRPAASVMKAAVTRAMRSFQFTKFQFSARCSDGAASERCRLRERCGDLVSFHGDFSRSSRQLFFGVLQELSMKRVSKGWIAVALGLALLLGRNSDAQERPFCDENVPGATCSDDKFEVVFPMLGANDISIFEYADFVAGTTIDAGVVLDAKSATPQGAGAIQGWSYAVKNDPAVLSIVANSATTDGTDVDAVFDNGFKVTGTVENGFYSGIVLSFLNPAVLPIQRNLVARVQYTLQADVGVAGTKLELVSGEIGPPGSPATDINITVSGRAFLPRLLEDGIVRKIALVAEDCTNGIDDDGDGLGDAEDPDCHECPCPGGPGTCETFALYFGPRDNTRDFDATGATSFVITSRNERELLGFQFGVKISPDGQRFIYQMSGELGTDAERKVEILMTDVDGASIAPATSNRLVTDTNAILGIERGAAIAGFAAGDFLEFDLDPGVGGPGFFVGYVSDLDGNVQRIAATGPDAGQGCPVNELLVVRLGASDCPGYAYYFGSQVGTETVDARGLANFAISSRNATALLGFQLGVRSTAEAEGVRFGIVDDIGQDSDRLIERLMTDSIGSSISPATPNDLLASSATVTGIRRGAAIAGFAGGDFFNFDLAPGVGGPGFYAGYVSDLDGAVNQIPATVDAECSTLNELLIVDLDAGGVCPAHGLAFHDATLAEVILEGNVFSIGSRNAQPLLGFQLGAKIEPSGDRFRFSFSNALGTDAERLVDLLFTTNTGDSITPSAINTLIAALGQVRTIERGSAISGFAAGDFFDFDLAPGVGGPGFFVGYVTDLDDNTNQIPATTGDGCPLNEILVVHLARDQFVCPENGFAFGADEVGTVELGDATQFAITGRSTAPLLGFQLGVAIRPEGELFRYAFSGSLGTDADRVVELLMTDNAGLSVPATAANELVASTGVVRNVSRGAVLRPFADGDFLAFDLEPGVGGPGFFVGYVTDLDDNTNQIPVPPALPDGACALGELLIVTLEGGGREPFIRGDADGNGRYNVSDAVIVIQEVLLNFQARFDCDDRLDVNDDETLDVSDALPILAWLFQAGPQFPGPFLVCEVDPTDNGDLGCVQANCTP